MKRIFISKFGTCAKYTKEANSFKTVMYLFIYPIVYSLSRKLDAQISVFLCHYVAVPV